MSKFLSEVKGFTPVIDVLAQELGLIAAVVYGIVWRYCQMEDRVCIASLDRIAEHANISRRTVERHIRDLCRAGYLEDKTPGRRHRPHIYADTGRAKITGLLTIAISTTESPTINLSTTESPESTTESRTSTTESRTQYDRKSHKETSYDSTHEREEERKTDLFDLAQKTVDAREKAGGNYAVPPSAGGADAFADGPVDAFAILLAGITPVSLPPKERQSWARKLRETADRWSTEDTPVTADDMERAIRAVPDSDIGWKTYTSPYGGNFETDIGPILLGGGQAKQPPRNDPDKFDRARAMTLERLEQRGNQ